MSRVSYKHQNLRESPRAEGVQDSPRTATLEQIDLLQQELDQEIKIGKIQPQLALETLVVELSAKQ